MRSLIRLCTVALLASLLTVTGGPVVAGAEPGPVAGRPGAARAASGTLDVRVGSLNLPGGQFGNQKRLLDQPERTRAAMRFLERESVSIVALQELSTPSRKLLRASPRWGVVSAPPNSTRGRSTIGNAVAFDSRTWVRVKADHVHLPVASRPRGLNMAVATLRRRGTDSHVVVMSIHHPVRSETNALKVRKRAKRFEIRYANRVRRQTGYPVVIAGDANERRGQGAYLDAGYDLGVRHVYDLVVAKGAELTAPQVYVDGVYLTFSDHALVTTLVRLRR